jgi:hypothetical protein
VCGGGCGGGGGGALSSLAAPHRTTVLQYRRKFDMLRKEEDMMMFGMGADQGVARGLLMDCTLCYVFAVLLILTAWPKYLAGTGEARVRNFGVSDQKTLGVFAGVVPFTVAAVLAVFVPLSVKHGMLSPKT